MGILPIFYIHCQRYLGKGFVDNENKLGGIIVGEKGFSTNKGLWLSVITPCICLAGGPGFEPGLTGPEPVVLPLDDPSRSQRKVISKAEFTASQEKIMPDRGC